MRALYQSTVSLLEAIEECLEKRRIVPCLALLYVGIDVIASLEAPGGEATRHSFIRWVDSYLFKARHLPCTALELYAARCGILHTFTSRSKLSKAGKVREIVYAWGNSKAEDLQKAAELIGRPYVAVQVRELVDGFRNGLATYLDEIDKDSARQSAVAQRAGAWFTNLQPGLLRAFLQSEQGNSAT